MSRRVPLKGLGYVVLATLFVSFVWVAVAQASGSGTRKYSLTGNLRAQIGDGLPIPITAAPPPNGGVPAIPGAVATQTVVNDKPKIVIKPAQFFRPQFGLTIPVNPTNSKVFQVRTSLGLTWPKATATFSAGGRSGPAVVTVCPGAGVVGPTTNPGCADPNVGLTRGRLKYTAIGAQFGGTAQAGVVGIADIALRAGGTALPCVGCNVIMAFASPQPTGAGGASFNAPLQTSPGMAPSPGLFTNATITKNGFVVAVAGPAGPGLINTAVDGGGPLTTGRVTITAPFAAGAPETLTVTGSDNRVNGVGSLSLVSGATSNRSVSGPNANRGWVNLVIADDVPAVSTGGILMIVALVLGATLYMARRATVSVD